MRSGFWKFSPACPRSAPTNDAHVAADRTHPEWSSRGATDAPGMFETRCVLDPLFTPSEFEDMAPGCSFEFGVHGDGARDSNPDLLGAIQSLVGSAEQFPDGQPEESA